MEIRKFEDIEAWQLARELTRRIYDLTKKAKFAIDHGLKKQIQNAAGSSMHNIAEFQDVYDYAGRTRACIRGFIKYLLAYKQEQGNP